MSRDVTASALNRVLKAPTDPTRYVHASALADVIHDPGPFAEPPEGHEWANTIAGTVVHDILCWRERGLFVAGEEAWDAEVELLASRGKAVAFAHAQTRESILRRIAHHVDATPRPGSLVYGNPLILTEASFRFYDEALDVWFAGTVDVLLIWPNGRVLIIDYKTGDHFPDLLLNPQLVLYPLAGWQASWTLKAVYDEHWHGLRWDACDDWFRLPCQGRPEIQVWYVPDMVAARENPDHDWHRTGIYPIPRPPIDAARNYLRVITEAWRRQKAPITYNRDPLADPEDLFAAGDPFGDEVDRLFGDLT